MKGLIIGLFVLTSPAAQDPPKKKVLAIRGAKIYTMSGAALENGVVLLENGKISAVGADVKVPEGAEVFDATGRVVIPGLVDAASRLFLSADSGGPGSPEQDVHDLLDPFSDDQKEALQAGVTTACIYAPSRGLFVGTDVVVKVGADRSKWILVRPAALRLSLGGAGAELSTSAQRYELYRALKQSFEGAKQYLELWEKYRKDHAEYEQKKKQWDEQQKKKAEKKNGDGKDDLKEEPKKPQKPRTDARNEMLGKALDPKTPLLVRIEVHHADTIEWALQLAQEHKLKFVLDQCTEGAKVSEAIAKSKASVLVGPVFRYGPRRPDYWNHDPATAANLSKAGVPVAIGSFPEEAAGHEGSGAGRFLMEAAAYASGKGWSREQALRAITAEPARILGIEKQVGSLEKGKSADLVVLSGEPFEADTRVERTMVDGEWVYQRKVE